MSEQEKRETSERDFIREALRRIEKKVEILTLIIVFAIVIATVVGIMVIRDLGPFLLFFVFVPLVILGTALVGIRFVWRAFGGARNGEGSDGEPPPEPTKNTES
jgi:hypothetical protein